MRTTDPKRELSLFAVKALQYESKRDLVKDYINKYWNDTGRIPEREDIQETYDAIYLDNPLVDAQIQIAKETHR